MCSETSTYFASKGFMSSGFFNLTPREAYLEATSNKAVFIDVREEALVGYKRFDVPLVAYIPKSELGKSIAEIPVDKSLIIADSAGLRSREAMMFLLEKGFKNIANLAGGIVEWERDGLPLLINNKERLDGSCVCQLKKRMR